MERMTESQRKQWMHGTKRQSAAILALVTARQIGCDSCAEPAISMTHNGEGSAVRCECGPCFLASLKAARAVRPSREQLVARVNAAIGR